MSKTDREILESMSKMDIAIDHDIETCGMCFATFLMAEVAREMLQANNIDIASWEVEWRRRWQEGKFYQLSQELEKIPDATKEQKLKRIAQAFADKGWEM